MRTKRDYFQHFLAQNDTCPKYTVMATVFAEDITGTLFQTKYNNNNNYYNINPYFHVV